jgi:sulfite reductase (NADPH) hemoprotein beta-component
VAKEAVAETIARLLEVYLRERQGEEERFLDTVRRIGLEPFQERVYQEGQRATHHSAA